MIVLLAFGVVLICMGVTWIVLALGGVLEGDGRPASQPSPSSSTVTPSDPAVLLDLEKAS